MCYVSVDSRKLYVEVGKKTEIARIRLSQKEKNMSQTECESALLTELFISLLTCCRNWFVMFWEEKRKCAFSELLHRNIPCLPAKTAKLLLSQYAPLF